MKTKIKPLIKFDFNFNSHPFTSSRVFTNAEIEKIWKYQYSNEKEEAKEFKIKKVFEKDEGMFVLIQKDNISDELFILKNPVTLSVEDKIKDLKIFTLNQMNNILEMFSNQKYIIYLNGEEYNSKNLSYTKCNKIEVKYKGNDYNEFKKYISGNNGKLIKEPKILTLEKSSLSFYFDQISKSNKNEKEFKLIIDENRINLFKKINEFYTSNLLFYLIMGTDGIGKTISFIYYSSCIYEYRILYLNLKLFQHSHFEKCEEIFFNELKRIFLFNYKYPNIGYEKYEILKKEILDYIYGKYSAISDYTAMEYTWLLLLAFLNIYTNLEIFPADLIIILDQYKIKDIDMDFIKLNQVLEKISNMNISVYLKIKLIIIISINNKDTKEIFLENLINFSIDNLSNNEKKNIPEKINKGEEPENNNEFNEIENYLKKKIYEIKNKYNKNLIQFHLETGKINSTCLLNSNFCELTQKEYFNDIVKCYNIVSENLNNDFLQCIKVFNGSLKYYELLLNEIDKNKKKENENDEIYRKRVLKSFYNLIYNKIKLNIEKSFIFINNDKDVLMEDLWKHCIKNLIELTKIISEEREFDIFYLRNILRFCPIKYLDIHLAYSEKMSLSDYEFRNYNFYVDYSSNFYKLAINKIIDDYKKYNKDFGGNEFGIEFEKEVNNQLSTINYHPKKLLERNIWALVGLTKNTKKYVQKLREKEKFEYYDLFNIRKLNFEIDGIDKEEIHINIKEEDVFLKQVSKTARSFDSGLLIKKNKISEDKTHDLILFQDTIYKILNIKKKNIYIEDSNKSKNYLESLYKGLKIDKIYFIFILPEMYPNIDKTIEKLKALQIYYVFFSLRESKFLDYNKNNIVSDFRIKESEISFSNINYKFNKALSDINISKKIFESSKQKFFKKKNKSGKRLIDIYEKLSEFNFHDCIQVTIPSKLKKNIIDTFISDNYFEKNIHINFLPSANYNELKIQELFKMTQNLIIFSFNNNMYFYYYCYYKINDNYTVEKKNSIDFGDNKNIVQPKKNLKDFKEIKNYSLFLFCYNVLKDYEL